MIDSFPISECEFLDIVSINPLISHCSIKVCYVGDEPNRKHSIITKDVAKEIAQSLPGSPIVGYYNESKEDFEDHNRILEIAGGQIKVKDATRPYGFVDLNAKVWFQKFDEFGVIREYLMTEGYIWTGQYPEARRIITQGNNQSMELDEETINAYWAKDNSGKRKFFIINEAIISKLCILGEDVEPCFEGAQINKFSLEDNFKEQLFSLVNQMQEILKKGGPNMDNQEILTEEEVLAPEVPAEEEETPVEEEATPAAEEEVPAAEEDADTPDEDAPAEEEAPAVTYSLEEIPEYVDLSGRFAELENNYAALQATNEELTKEINDLREFKYSIQKKEKEAMIQSFYMLSDEDKQDVINNIDAYSLEDIEAKLSIICVRNRVNFSLDDEDPASNSNPMTYSLDGGSNAEDAMVPAWIKAIKDYCD